MSPLTLLGTNVPAVISNLSMRNGRRTGHHILTVGYILNDSCLRAAAVTRLLRLLEVVLQI